MDFNWDVVSGAAGAAAIKVVWDVVKFYLERRKNDDDAKFKTQQLQVENLFQELISAAVDIQNSLEQFAEAHRVARVLVVRLENGGGVPQLGTVQHISVINEVVLPDGLRPMKQEFQNMVIDGSYQKVLVNMLAQSEVVVKTTDLDAGFMRAMYDSDGVKQTIKLLITHLPDIGKQKEKGFLIYMVIQLQDERVIDAKLRGDYLLLREKIKQRFNDFYKKRLGVLDGK
jgi:hypothetical protein